MRNEELSGFQPVKNELMKTDLPSLRRRGRGRGLFVVALVICAMLGSCKARQTVVRERYAVHDTVWSVRNDVSARRDSIVYYEFTDVRPHVIKLRDTTIVYTDTIIRSVANNTRYVGLWQYRDTGRIVRDTAYVDRKVVVSKKENATKDNSHKWRWFAAGIIIGVLLSVAWKYRRKLWAVVKAAAKRIS